MSKPRYGPVILNAGCSSYGVLKAPSRLPTPRRCPEQEVQRKKSQFLHLARHALLVGRELERSQRKAPKKTREQKDPVFWFSGPVHGRNPAIKLCGILMFLWSVRPLSVVRESSKDQKAPSWQLLSCPCWSCSHLLPISLDF